MRADFNTLRQLLQFELHGAERHRRFLSLVMVTTDNDVAGLRNFLGAHIRESDVIANFDHSVAVLMGETDTQGALTAVDRYKDLFDTQIDLRFSIATYPADGGRPDGLIKAAHQRLNIAKSAGSGAVVHSD